MEGGCSMTYLVDGWNNFCRVFEIPKSYPGGFLFGGGKPVSFQMIDWFQPVGGVIQPAITKERGRKEVGEIETKNVSIDELQGSIIPWLQEKKYVKHGRTYLVLCDFGAALQFSA